LRFVLLGPLEALMGGRSVALGGRRSRTLVAVLVLHPNEPVRRDALIEAIWGNAPPGSASHALDNLVSRVRGQLGADVLQSRPGGYVLVVDPARVDAFRFEALAGQGRDALARGEPERAAGLLREALGLWRGEPLADLADEPALADEIRRLADARAVAVEDRVDADLGLGRHGALVSELRSLVAQEPLRERRRVQLMLALYRSGQHAEALRVYREAQAYLAGELGLEPGRELRALELAIVRHDPELAPPRAPPASGARAAAPKRRRGQPRRRLLGAAMLLGAAALVGAVALVTAGGSSEPASISLRGGGVVVVGKDGVTSVATDVGLSGLASLGGAVWASSYASGRVIRVDPARGAVTQTVPVGQGPGSVVAAAGDLWVVDAVGGRVVRVDGATGQVVQHVRVGESPVAVAAGFGSVWAASAGDQSVARLDPRSGRVTARIEVGAAPAAMSAGAGGVWVAEPEGRRVVRIEPRGEVIDVTVPVGGGPRAVSASGDAVWVANTLDATVSRVDPSLGQVLATTPVGGAPVALAADADGVWVAVRDDQALVRLTGPSARVARRVGVGGRPVALDLLGESVAVAVSAAAGEHRGGTVRVAALLPVPSLDPADCCVIPPEIPAVLYDGLTGFDRLSSSAPSLVADLAVALPAPTAGGTVYTFTLRPDLRYSTGAPVRASDFRRAAERVVRAGNEGARAFEHLDGVSRCPRGRPCDLRDSVVADDAAATVSFHLARPDPEFLYKLAGHVTAPVPVGAPVTVGTRALPSTGPYRVRRFTASREIVLERNPFFSEWSPTAQPAGRPDRIVFSLGGRPDDAAAAVLRGAADVMLGAPSQAVLARLRTEHPGQLHLHTAPGLFWAWLNTRAAPFDDVRVRRALNLAVDRDAAVDVFGGPGTALATCQAIPPGISGYARYCPYTRRPTATGRWQGPDLARAKRLVAGTHNRGMLVTYWTFNLREDAGLARLTLRALRQLGYRTRLRFLDDPPPSLRPDQVQAAGAGGTLDYPSARPFLSPFLSCRGWRARRPGDVPNPSAFCDREMIAAIAAAVRLETVAPDRARRRWAAADRRLVDQAAWVPLVNPVAVYVTGSRVGNYAWSPAVGALVDQMWVR
jgi:ABC-type transport system substrate-binding protein/DNA-binding SARP family transcriptional activator/sugar lactone lactonase YvrE